MQGKDVDQRIEVAQHLKSKVRKYHVQSVKHAKKNWWDLMLLYEGDEKASETILDTMLEMIHSEELTSVY